LPYLGNKCEILTSSSRVQSPALLGRGVLGRRNLWPSLCVAQDRLCFAAATAIQKAAGKSAERKAKEDCGHSPGQVLQLPGSTQVCSALLEKVANK